MYLCVRLWNFQARHSFIKTRVDTVYKLQVYTLPGNKHRRQWGDRPPKNGPRSKRGRGRGCSLPAVFDYF